MSPAEFAAKLRELADSVERAGPHIALAVGGHVGRGVVRIAYVGNGCPVRELLVASTTAESAARALHGAAEAWFERKERPAIAPRALFGAPVGEGEPS